MRLENQEVHDPEEARLRKSIYAEFGAAIHPDKMKMLVRRLKHEDHEWHKVVSAVMLVLLLMYFVVMKANIVYFTCRVSNGKLVWTKEPEMQCYDFKGNNLHARLLPVVIAALLVYGLGIPFLFWRMLSSQRDIISGRMSIIAGLKRKGAADSDSDSDTGSLAKKTPKGSCFGRVSRRGCLEYTTAGIQSSQYRFCFFPVWLPGQSLCCWTHRWALKYLNELPRCRSAGGDASWTRRRSQRWSRRRGSSS